MTNRVTELELTALVTEEYLEVEAAVALANLTVPMCWLVSQGTGKGLMVGVSR